MSSSFTNSFLLSAEKKVFNFIYSLMTIHYQIIFISLWICWQQFCGVKPFVKYSSSLTNVHMVKILSSNSLFAHCDFVESNLVDCNLLFIGHTSYNTIMKELSVAREPLSFFIIVICDLWPTYTFLLPFSDCSFGNGHIDHLTDLLNDFT